MLDGSLSPTPAPTPTPTPQDLSAKWLNWMSTGLPLSSPPTPSRSSPSYVSHNKITYREDSNLGGIPRMERYTARDWLHNVYTLRTSSVLRQIKSPVQFCFWWGVLVSLVHRFIVRSGHAIGDHILITKTPHSLLGSALGLLLVFRTNTAYARFWEGRKIWEKVASVSRDLSRMAMLYEGEMGGEKLGRAMGLVAAFPYLLRQRVQPRWLLKKGDFGGGEERTPEGRIATTQAPEGPRNVINTRFPFPFALRSQGQVQALQAERGLRHRPQRRLRGRGRGRGGRGRGDHRVGEHREEAVEAAAGGDAGELRQVR